MSSWIYRKPEPPTERGLCVICGKNPQKSKKRGTYCPLCSQCDKRRYRRKWRKKIYIKAKYGKYKLTHCELCGFKAFDRCQLDVHHVDGNHHNNDPNNLQTLCANCHRLVHKQRNPPGD